MNVHKLEPVFNPSRIVLVGVSINPKSVSGMIVSNLVRGGYRGVIYPVNPDAEAIQGIACYASIKDLPKTPDLAIICSAAPDVPEHVRQCGAAGINGIIIVSAGFREAGEEGRALEEEVLAVKKKFSDMRIIGPNCLGVISPGHYLNASFAKGMPQKGHIAFISQSGALCTSVLDWAIKEKIGFSHFISVGNTLDVDFGDIIDYLGEDEETEAIILYIESIKEARSFLSAARAFARTKPIIVYKAGRFPQSAEVAASHTGALAAEDSVYKAAFQRAGVVRVTNIDDIFHCAGLIGRKKVPGGPRLGIVTNAGGPGVMATDTLLELNGELAELSKETLESLDLALPPMWSGANPVDVLGDARSKRIAKAVDIVIRDKGVDAVLVILTPQAMTNATAAAKAVARVAAETRKPVLAAWMGGKSMDEGVDLLNDAGVPTYLTPEQGVRAFMTLVDYARNLESLYQTPKDISVEFPIDRWKLREEFESLVRGQGNMLNETVSKTLLEAYGIKTARPVSAVNVDDAVQAAGEMGYPVVLKIDSPDISHKSDAGGVILNLTSDEEVKAAYKKVVESAKKYNPDARITGVTVQPFIMRDQGVELILGTKKAAVFGTVIMAGAGGVTAELYEDTMLGLPPLNEKLARRMLSSLKIWPMLTGFRGSRKLDIEGAIETMIRLSYLAADYPEISEMDINPLLVKEKGVTALDARIAIDTGLVGREVKPYSHLALRPYPEELVKSAVIDDGTEILLRPIKPEDEPLWFDLLGSCSRESIYMRFRYAFHWHSHEVASRYCFNDYDREIAIVAEVEEGEDGKKLVGVGRLVADPDHETVEYAILIADAWQNRGLGGVITDYCMDISMGWGLKSIVAQTTTDNGRMIAVFRKRGFVVDADHSSGIVNVEKKFD